MAGIGQLVQLEGVSCVRGGRQLFAGLNLMLGAGQSALVTGPNGVGKSSLLRVIAGLLAPASGIVKVEGRLAVTNEAGMLDQNAPLAQALSFWAGLDSAAPDAIEDGLNAMGIAHLADVPVRILSNGQKKRAILAGIIAGRADIWLLDEPTNGLDTTSIALLETAIERHLGRGGIVIAATHQPLSLGTSQMVALA
jgi:heme exporter protein A